MTLRRLRENQAFLRELWAQILEAKRNGDSELAATLAYKWMAVSRRVDW